MAPDRSRAAYQGSRSRPCEEWPHRSACTRESTTSAASSPGTPSALRTPAPNALSDSGSNRCSATTCILHVLCADLYTVSHTRLGRSRVFSLVVQMEVWPGRREEFLAGMAANAEASVRDEPGCLRFDVCSVQDDENRFVLYELYADADAFAAHKASPHFARWRTVADRVVRSQVNTPGELLVTHTPEEFA